MGNKLTVNSGSSEPPQVPTLPVIATPPLMTSSVGVSSTKSSLSSTGGGAPEEFRRKVPQAANSEPRPPPPPNAIIRDPNNPKQMVGASQELGSSEPPPMQPISAESSKLQPPESEKTYLDPTCATPVPPTLTHMGTTVGGATVSMDETVSVVAQLKHQLLQSETIDSAESGSSRPSDIIQPEREKQENVEEETKLTNETERGGDKSTLMTDPSQLVAEAVEAATGDEPVPEVRIRMRHEKIGESLAAVSEKGTLSM